MTSSRATTEGTLIGVLVAVLFALLIRVVPDEWLRPESWRLGLLFLGTALGAPLLVLIVGALAHARGAERAPMLAGSLAGAAVFDGTAIAFVPDLYGHTGAPLAGAASALLFGLAMVAFAGRVVPSSAHATDQPARLPEWTSTSTR